MFFIFLVIVGIEMVLNIFFWCDKVFKFVCQCLLGKVLWVQLQDFVMFVVLVFSECQVDVLSVWDGEVDCIVIIWFSVLLKLCNCQQFMVFICSGDLEVQGDLQVVQNMVFLCDLVEFDFVELLVFYIGDIVVEGVGKVLCGGVQFLLKGVECQQCYVVEVIIEEWCLVLGLLELVWFVEEIMVIECVLVVLEKWLEMLEGK